MKKVSFTIFAVCPVLPLITAEFRQQNFYF